jgi:hypothetical protein
MVARVTVVRFFAITRDAGVKVERGCLRFRALELDASTKIEVDIRRR